MLCNFSTFHLFIWYYFNLDLKSSALLFPRLDTFESLPVSHRLCLLIPLSMTTPRAVHPMSNNNCIIYLKFSKRVDFMLCLITKKLIIIKRAWGNSERRQVCPGPWSVSWVYTYSQMPQLYTINTYSFLHANHASIKWFL